MAIFKKNNLKGDVFGGITAGIVALPLALAFGIQAFSGIDSPEASSLGALAGLVGATMLGFFASLFGGTPSQISGPTGPMTVITAALVAGAWNAYGTFSTVVVAMSLAGLFCGLFQILFGVLKIGKYIRYIPYPVLSGFMSGIGVIIILQQIYPLFGLKAPVLILDMLEQFPSAVPGMNPYALILGLATVAIIYIFPRFSNKVPATLVALIAVTVVSLFLPEYGVPVIGEIPSGLPMPFFLKGGVSLEGIEWGPMIVSALVPGITLAGLGCIDTLLTSVVADNITKTHHKSNRELIGQGIGNAVSGFFCGIAGAGATMRTVVNVKSGGRGRLSGMIHALMLLAILLGLGRFVKFVPLSVLAGILITVGIGIIDFKGLKDLFKVPASDAVILLAVFVITVFVDLLTAVGVGMVIACVVYMKKSADLTEASYNASQDEKDPARLVITPGAPVFFGSVTRFSNMIQEIPDTVKTVVFDMKDVSYLDQSGLYAFETALADLRARGCAVETSGLNEKVASALRAVKIEI